MCYKRVVVYPKGSQRTTDFVKRTNFFSTSSQNADFVSVELSIENLLASEPSFVPRAIFTP